MEESESDRIEGRNAVKVIRWCLKSMRWRNKLAVKHFFSQKFTFHMKRYFSFICFFSSFGSVSFLLTQDWGIRLNKRQFLWRNSCGLFWSLSLLLNKSNSVFSRVTENVCSFFWCYLPISNETPKLSYLSLWCWYTYEMNCISSHLSCCCSFIVSIYVYAFHLWWTRSIKSTQKFNFSSHYAHQDRRKKETKRNQNRASPRVIS